MNSRERGRTLFPLHIKRYLYCYKLGNSISRFGCTAASAPISHYLHFWPYFIKFNHRVMRRLAVAFEELTVSVCFAS